MSHFTLSTSSTSLKNPPLVTERREKKILEEVGLILSYFNVLLCFSFSRPSISQKKLLILFFEGIPQVKLFTRPLQKRPCGDLLQRKLFVQIQHSVDTHSRFFLLSQPPPAQTYQMVQEFKSVTFVKGPRFFNH